jgi:DNA replication and repair protein RecF
LRIDHLQVQNLRIFKSISFKPTKKINLISGPNGAGKTSLLEAIYLLARNRSFRTNNYASLINSHDKELIISATLVNDSGKGFQIGLKKSTNNTELHIAGEKQKRLSDQARMIPMSIITTSSNKLITEGPKNRRKFLNWGVFHVEPKYADLMSKYNKILLQRNNALRNQQKSYRAWDSQLIYYGKEIDTLRKKYLHYYQIEFARLAENFETLPGIQIRYTQGWNQNLEFSDALKDRDDLDLKYTYSGPHRADIGFYVDSVKASEYLSNGQIKILSILLILSQLKLVKKITRETPILLIDDIQSELDRTNLIRVVQLLKKLNTQTFVTSIVRDIYLEDALEDRMFHVEHGEIY